MKCRKCGREADSNLTFCPSCGTRLKEDPDLDEITVSIAGKVDLFMNEDKSEKEKNTDGIRIIDGQMISEDENEKTITRKAAGEAETASIFDEISKSLENDEEEEPEPVIVSDGRKARRSDPDDEDVSGEMDKKEKSKNTGLIIGIIVGVILVIAIIIGCLFIFGVFDGSRKTSKNTTEESEQSQAEDVITCSVTEGEEYTAPVEITVESSAGNRIYYTLDGSTPSVSSYVYSDSITIDDSYVDSAEGTEITLKVVSYTDSSMKSAELEVTFTVVYADVEAPVISPSSGNYSEETYISISAESGAKIYYTTDGTTPDESSNLYTGQFEMERGNTVITAIAVKNGVSSAETTAVYNLEIESLYTFSEAKELVLTSLINRGTVKDEDGNTSDGYVEFMDDGTCIIDNNQYIVVICNFYDEDDELTDTVIYGVDDQTGTVSKLTETDSGYTK